MNGHSYTKIAYQHTYQLVNMIRHTVLNTSISETDCEDSGREKGEIIDQQEKNQSRFQYALEGALVF
ncbi:hypothetical protein [Paenibacillus sinensis]|uniref:hypothetical protein n=1 Tax=Paenibacillus sinensis TaxID=2834413 RepID=UPI001CA8C5F5|nr:hypothetical protein [Paenibacillus sinensis]